MELQPFLLVLALGFTQGLRNANRRRQTLRKRDMQCVLGIRISITDVDRGDLSGSATSDDLTEYAYSNYFANIVALRLSHACHFHNWDLATSIVFMLQVRGWEVSAHNCFATQAWQVV